MAPPGSNDLHAGFVFHQVPTKARQRRGTVAASKAKHYAATKWRLVVMLRRDL